jgi:hypothetical protein
MSAAKTEPRKSEEKKEITVKAAPKVELTPEEEAEFKEIFSMVDTDGSETIRFVPQSLC